MSVESNKQVIKQYFEAINRGDEQGILGFLTDDFKFECMAVKPERFHFIWDRNAFAAAPRLMSRFMHKPIQIWIESMTGDEDRVAVEAKSHGELKNGKLYENAYHFLFRLRDGKLCSAREYSCSHLAQECFGEYEATFD
jgi:ketosteroid isomerase-like protein